MEKLISVIVPVYKVEEYLNKCVDSIINQTYKNLEIILVDDGSPDNCPKICDEYALKDNRIKVLHKKNGGLSSARNAGMEIATGDFVIFVDSDDYLETDAYEKMLKIYDDLLVLPNTLYVRVDEDGNVTKSRVPHKGGDTITNKDFLRELLLHDGDVSTCTKLFPKEIFNGISFDETKANEDLLFMLKVIPKIKGFVFTDSVGYNYFMRKGSLSSSFSKAIKDMVPNSLVAKDFALTHFLNEKGRPTLKKEAERFALYQHMAHILAVPYNLANKENKLYIDTLKYIRKNTWKNLFNKYLKLKDKLILIGLSICPKFTKKLKRNKNK